jgi:gluconolactonase
MRNKDNMIDCKNPGRRKTILGLSIFLTAPLTHAQSFVFKPNQRYPDASILILDPSFEKYRLYNSTLEQLSTGMRWSEGPAYFPYGEYLLFSDIPNNRIMKYSEKTGKTTIFRGQANFANGNTRDNQGRLITCEHSVTRRVTRTEASGKITVIADSFEGKRLNAPNDVIVKSDNSIWFTDPTFGINGEWEGFKAKSEQKTTNVYRVDSVGKISAVITDLVNPNGLAFSPNEKKLYVVESSATPNNCLWVYDLNDDGTLSGKTKLIDPTDNAAIDGLKVDIDGNLWLGYGTDGAIEKTPSIVQEHMAYPLKSQPEQMDGVMVLNSAGKKIGFIKLPERCANLTFGGPKNNRLYMASSHSIYSLYVNTQGAVTLFSP